MKIFKYLLLLLLLFSFAFFVFVFTKDGRYAFEEKMTINLGNDVVVPYIDNNKQWPVWFEFDFPIDQLKIAEKSIVWDKNINKIKKTFSKDSIKYQFKFKDIDYITFIKIKGNRGKTEIIWKGSGEMTFQEKLFYYLPFETSTSIQDKLTESLTQLKNYLTARYLKHNIVFGKVELYPSQEIYLSPFTSTPDSLIFNRYKHEKKLDSIFGQKGLKASKDHCIFSYSSDWTPTAQTFEVAKFLEKDSLFFASKTKLITTKPFYALKVTLQGNYTFKKDVYVKLDKYLSSIKHQRSDLGFVVEKQLKTTFDNLPENEWLTEFYFPVKVLIEPKAVLNPSNKPKTLEKRTIAPEQSKPREPIAPVERVVIPVESGQPIEPPKENNPENN